MKAMIPVLLAATAPALIAFAQTDTYADELKTLRAEYTKKQRDLLAPAGPSESAEERQKRTREPLLALQKEYAEKYQALAEKAKGTPTGLAAGLMALQLGGVTAEKLDELITTEAKNPDMARNLRTIVGLGQRFGKVLLGGWLETIQSKTPYDGVKAEVMLQRANLLNGDESVALIKELIARFPTTNAANTARGMLFEKENLQIGKLAPEIESTDENGQKITLSEYRGKVVVLDFWGFW